MSPMSAVAHQITLPMSLRLMTALTLVGSAVVAGWVSGEVALLLGMAMGLSGLGFGAAGSKAATWSLRVCVVMLGFRTELGDLLRASAAGFGYAMLTIGAALVAGWVLGKLLDIESATSTLISAGTAICGGSAIAAVGPAINAKPSQMTVAFGTVFVLNAVSLMMLPSLGHYLGMSPQQFGTFAGMAIHDVASVVGAAQAFGAQSLETATSVKLSRALWIIPLAVGMAWWHNRQPTVRNAHHAATVATSGRTENVGGETPPRKKPSLIPWVMICFLAAAATRSLFSTWFTFLPVGAVAQLAMALTLFLIGTSISISVLKSVGPRAILQGTLVWLVLLLLSAGVALQNS